MSRRLPGLILTLTLSFSTLIILSCGGGGANKPTGSTEKLVEPSAEIPLKDKLKNYATARDLDITAVEKSFNDNRLDGVASFTAGWLNFFKATDPAFAGFDTFLPITWAQFAFGFALGGLEPVRERLILEEAGDGDSTTGDRRAARLEEMKKAITGFNSILFMTRERLIEDAGFFGGLNAAIAIPAMFPVPEKFFGGATDEQLDGLKEPFTQLLYTASLKIGEKFFSFFQFAERDEGSAVRSSRRIGKFVFGPAETNVLFKAREGLAPVELIEQR